MTANMEFAAEKKAAYYVEETLGHGAIFDAKQASDDEHSQTLWQAIKANRKAIGWSVLISMSIFMEGYDTSVMGNLFAYPEFQKVYGTYYGPTVGYQIPTRWQTGLGMASNVGAIFG
jgi:MFS transporter, SP family, general alpha glucoside:H+ symporter